MRQTNSLIAEELKRQGRKEKGKKTADQVSLWKNTYRMTADDAPKALYCRYIYVQLERSRKTKEKGGNTTNKTIEGRISLH